MAVETTKITQNNTLSLFLASHALLSASCGYSTTVLTKGRATVPVVASARVLSTKYTAAKCTSSSGPQAAVHGIEDPAQDCEMTYCFFELYAFLWTKYHSQSAQIEPDRPNPHPHSSRRVSAATTSAA